MRKNKLTYEDALNKIELIGGQPIAVEAQWDGDTEGWFLMMFVIVKKGIIKKRIETHHLGNISMGGDIRIFQGTVPPYPEAEEAQKIGMKLREKYNLEFFFPSPNSPDDNCPRWEEKENAIICADCNKLIIPTDSPYLPKDICYNCHLKREQNERIRNEVPYSGGVSIYLFKDGYYQFVGSSTKFESLTISKHVKHIVERDDLQAIQIVTVDRDDVKKLILDIENELTLLLRKYEKPKIDERMSKFVSVVKIMHKGKEIELMDRMNSHHRSILELYGWLEIAYKAEKEGFEYKMFFKNNFTYRDDSILRFVGCSETKKLSKEKLTEKYRDVLTDEQVNVTIDKLIEFGCLKEENAEIVITDIGEKIL